MKNLIQVISELDKCLQRQKELQGAVNHLRQLIPEENNRLQIEAQQEENEIKNQIHQATRKASLELSTVVESTKIAYQLLDEQKESCQKSWQEEISVINRLYTNSSTGELSTGELSFYSSCLSWNHPYWNILVSKANGYKPLVAGLAPEILRIGELLIEQIEPPVRVPAIVPMRKSSRSSSLKAGHIGFFSSDTESRQLAIKAIESVALRVISSFPLRKLKCVFIDPINMGNSFPFKALHPFISGQKTYTRSDDIREQLRELTEHIEQVIQNYLGKKYQSIEDYNLEAQSVAEPYRYLFIADFPSGFDNQSWEDIKSILLNGAKAGVYVILHIDENLEKPRNFDYRIFENYCTVIRPAFGLNTGAKPKVGNVYAGYVTQMTAGGAYIEILPDIQGFVPLAKLPTKLSSERTQPSQTRISRPEDVLSHNQRITVKVTSVNDSKNEIELTCLDIHPDEIIEANRKDFRSLNYKNNNIARLFEMRLPNGLAFKLELDQPPPDQQFNQVIDTINEAIKSVKLETVSFSELFAEENLSSKREWPNNTQQEIRVPIGLMGARDTLDFWLGENDDGLVVSQALLAGKPGSGKSYTLHAIIIGLATRYAPDELEMYLLDFKEGVEFQIYVDPERSRNRGIEEELNEEKALPHAKAISIESDREFGLSVLQAVQSKIEDRGTKFKATGVSTIKEYRQKTNEKMPRILVVIDEFQYLFQDNDNITRQLNLIFEDITRRGRAFGVHLLIASQSPNVPNMSNRIYSFIELRMAQQMDKNTAASVLAEGNTDAVDLLDKPGKIIYNKDFGRKNHNEIGQVADISLDNRISSLLKIQEITRDRGYQRPQPLILFNGSRPSKLSHNRQLMQLSKMSSWLSLRDLNKQVLNEKDWIVQENPGVAWLGEAMRIGNHTRAIFRRRPRSNMILVGSSEENIFGILGGMILSLVHCYEPKQAQFNIIDLSQPDPDNSWTELSINLRNAFSDYFDIVVGKRFPDSENNIQRGEAVLAKTYEEFERRLQRREENPDEMNFGASLFLLYAMGGLNRAQNLRPITGRRGEEPSSDAQRVLQLISQGSELGIHVIFWVDDLKNFLKMTGDNRSWLTHFDLRVALTMPPDDSRILLGETHAQHLSRLRAYFRDDSSTLDLEKFKPYAIPNESEIERYSQQFQQRSL